MFAGYVTLASQTPYPIIVYFLASHFEFPTYPKNPKICDPILVNLLEMRPHFSQSSRENATPSSGKSLLASCKGVPPGHVNAASRESLEIPAGHSITKPRTLLKRKFA